MAPRRRPLRRAGNPWVELFARFPYAAVALAVICVLALLLSALGARWGWWHFRTGFAIMRWAAYGGILTTVLALIGAAFTRPASGRPGFWAALAALAVGALMVAYPYSQLRIVYTVPFIHDITTDTIDPPAFVDVAPLRADADNPAPYGGPEVAQQQQAGYPDLAPVRFAAPPEAVFPAAEETARAMGWEMVATMPEEGRIEATDTTFWYGFKDDIVIRVAGAEGGTVVDVRSKSRVGRSDLGVNAERIRAYLAHLQARMGG